MKFWRGFGLSTRALFAHQVRTTLALASVAAGVAALVVTGAIGTGAEKEVLRQTENMGTNLLVVRPAQIKSSAARKQIRGVVTSLKPEDYEAIRELAPVEQAVPGIESALTVNAGGNAMSAMVLGTTSPYMEVCRFRLQRGRFLDDEDNWNARRVAVLGARVNDTVFDSQDAIGQDIRIRGVPFEIIGILEAKGVLADGSDEDNEVLIPVRTALRRVFNSTWLNPVFVSVRDPGEMAETENAIAKLLRDRHRLEPTGKPDDFSIQNKTRVLAAQKQVAESLNRLATSLAAISLFVGGTGILALMLMSVKERTPEIGLRIAVGARPRDILIQFFMEATFLAVGGWAVGITLGTLGAAVVAFATSREVAMSLGQVLATLGMVFTIAVLFGGYPARKASLVPPIEALQVE